MIHVCYGLYDRDGRYSKFTGTSMVSIFENCRTPPHCVTIHILHDNTLTEENRDKFIYLAGRYGQLVKFYNVDKLCAEKIAEFRKLFPSVDSARFTIGTMYRLVMTDLFPADMKKIIYLDSDILVNLDIKELWEIQLGEKPLAAVAESVADPLGFPSVSKQHYLVQSGLVKYEDYFNAAVLLINLERLRSEEKLIAEGTKFIAEHTECFCFDQDILNYCFTKEYFHLPSKFDQFVARAPERIKQKISPRRVIYHYTGGDPTFDLTDALNKLYMEYFSKTPWFGLETLEHIYEGVLQIYNEQKNFSAKLSALLAGKERSFFTTTANIPATKQIFQVADSEEILIADSEDSMKNLIQAMKNSRGKKIFFLLVGNFFAVAPILRKEGFEFGKDFLNATDFLSTTQGGSFNSYPIVKLL